MISKYWFAIFILLQPISSYCQMDTLMVSQNQVDASFLKPFEVNWLATQHFKENDSTTIIYRVKERFETVEEDSKKLWKFTQYWNDKNGKNIYTTVRVADFKTLEYVAFHTGTAPGVIAHLDFEDDYVSGFVAFDSYRKAKQIGAYMDVPPFASMGGLLYVVLLKSQNKDLTIPTFSWGGKNPKLVYDEITIKGEEQIFLKADDPRRARIVKSSRNPNNTYWVTIDAPPYFLKLSVEGKGQKPTTIFEVEDFKLIKK